jgi:hypothetical protein
MQFLDDIYQLRLEVYTIGYPSMGESQIILLKEGSDNVLFSCVIDCYATNGVNKTLDILKQNAVSSLDYFIWTHTDEDHSIGIDKIIQDCCSNATEYILPEGVTGNERDFIEYHDEIKTTFATINSFNTHSSYRVNTATVVKGGHSRIFYKKFSDKTRPIKVDFEIIAIAPISPIIRRRWETGIARKKNDLSIATIFKIGELSLLFSGDIENQSIQHIPSYYFEDLSYVKTPHHTSTTSTDLLDKIAENYTTNKIPSTVSTVYKSSSLPNTTLVQEYLKYSENFTCTGNGTMDYGYVKTVYDVLNKVLLSEEIEGNAHRY